MRSKADETLVIVETLICPLQIFQNANGSTVELKRSSLVHAKFFYHFLSHRSIRYSIQAGVLLGHSIFNLVDLTICPPTC